VCEQRVQAKLVIQRMPVTYDEKRTSCSAFVVIVPHGNYFFIHEDRTHCVTSSARRWCYDRDELLPGFWLPSPPPILSFSAPSDRRGASGGRAVLDESRGEHSDERRHRLFLTRVPPSFLFVRVEVGLGARLLRLGNRVGEDGAQLLESTAIARKLRRGGRGGGHGQLRDV